MKALTQKELRAKAPAIFAVGRDETRTSDRYQPIHTLDAIKFMGEEGYQVTDAQQMFATKKDNRFTRHLVMFTHEDADLTGEVVPRILMFNSHNGTTALKLQTGFFRFVCANGLIVGDTVNQVRMRHSPAALDILGDQLQHAAGVAKKSGDLIERWKAKELSTGAMEAFANEAVKIRTGAETSAYDPAIVLEARREEDEGNDLWTVFNRVQETLTVGGIQGLNANGRHVTMRGLNNIRRNTEFNQALWQLAEQVAA